MSNQKKGFTLIELLIVIGIIAILAAIIFVAVDPARRAAEARNTERWAVVKAISDAYFNYTVDQAGKPPMLIGPGLYCMINDNSSSEVSGCTAAVAQGHPLTCRAVFTNTLVGTYLPNLPVDPKYGTPAKTFYYIGQTPNGRIVVGACKPEAINGVVPVISVSR